MKYPINIIEHKHFTQELKNIGSCPKQLYFVGAPLGAERKITVVGTRKPTSYGKMITRELVKLLVEAGFTIVSGLAYGIDALAHEVAVESGGKCIAVLPCGLDKIYPASNRNLAIKILKSGGTLLSEYEAGTAAFKSNFAARNRIQSGLSEAVLIIEANRKSGTLITAKFALEQGRDVLAVPGNISSESSYGTNNLIREGATPIIDKESLLEALNLGDFIKAQGQNYQYQNQEEAKIVEILKAGSKSEDEIMLMTGMTIGDFSQNIINLELSGVVAQELPGQWSLR